MLVNMKDMLLRAKEGKYAIPQFNINNLEWTRFILEGCEENKSPVILGVSEGAAKYFGGYKTVVNVVEGLINDLNITIPVAIHLDHGSSVEACKKAIDAGFTSVMIDASKYPISENVGITNEVVEMALLKDATIEAEVGCVGGSEDGVASEEKYATFEDAKEIVENTKITCLAPALGSVHGLYKGLPNLNFERMEEISTKLNIPLVLHGGTGIPDDQIAKSIACGICKININTELQVEWSKGVREFLENNKEVYDPRKVIKSGEENMKKVITDKVKLFGSYNKA